MRVREKRICGCSLTMEWNTFWCGILTFLNLHFHAKPICSKLKTVFWVIANVGIKNASIKVISSHCMSDLRQSRQLCCYLVSYGNSAVLHLIMKSEKILYMVLFSILKIDSVTSIETTISDFEDYEELQDNSTIIIEKPNIKNFVIVSDTLSFTFNERDCMDSLREL